MGSIIQHAGEFDADLIVVATHGWGGMRDLMVGSIAQQVLRRGSLPVLLVRPTSDGGAPPFDGKELLVPLDGTDVHDRTVIPMAEQLASDLDSTVHLLMVVSTRDTLRGDQRAVARLAPTATAAALDMQEAAAADYLQQTTAEMIASGLDVRSEVRRGDPVAAVAGRAEELNADLIVMATHARAGWNALWTGSVGAKIMSRSRQPMLLVRVPEASSSGRQ